MISSSPDDGQRVLDIGGELPTEGELRFVADQRTPTHVGRLRIDTLDLDLLDPIDLRVYITTIRNVDATARMRGLRHLRIDERLELPAGDLQHHLARQIFCGAAPPRPRSCTAERPVLTTLPDVAFLE